MNQVNFADVDEYHLLGDWTVQSRIISESDPQSIFAAAEKHSFLKNGIYSLSGTKKITGSWDMTKKDELIRNPLIRFIIPQNGTTNAIITRLLFSADMKAGQLTLYLSTGLELVLLKKLI